MRQTLKLHRDSQCKAVTRIEVEVTRPRPDALALHYFVTGNIGDVRWPELGQHGRSDGLWQHTCFEAFIRASAGLAYFEFNFSPSLQWAAYRFDGYRSGMRVSEAESDPQLGTQSGTTYYALKVLLTLDLPIDAVLRLGLSAVIEETNGGKSYWALAHPAGKADFHHADCFAYELPVADRL